MGGVSILVVVDCSRQLPREPAEDDRQSGFNPCCGGLQSSTRWSSDGPKVRACFNPCCGGLQSSTGLAEPVPMAGNTMFQSLLWWIAVVNPARLAGTAIGARFQSLLWWIAVVNCEPGLRS